MNIDELFSYDNFGENSLVTFVYANQNLFLETKSKWHISTDEFLCIPYLINERILVLKVKGVLSPKMIQLMEKTVWQIIETNPVRDLIAVSDFSQINKLGLATPSELYALISTDISNARKHEYIIPSPKIKTLLRLHRMLFKDFRNSTTIKDTFEEGLVSALATVFGTVKKLDSNSQINDLQTLRISQLTDAIKAISLDQNFEAANFDLQEGDPFKNLFEAFKSLAKETVRTLHEIAEVNQNLENIIEERTERLLNLSRKLLKTNLQLDRFIYSTSHELRAPISSTQGLLELITLENDDQVKIKYVNTIKTIVSNQDELLKQIILFRDNKKSLLLREQIKFDELIHNVIKDLGLDKDQSNLKLEVRANQISPFFTDRERLNLVLYQLIKNAYQYSDNKRITIDIKVQETHLIIIIEDDGIGIPEVELPKIFDLFYRASEQRTGHGFGLFIVKETVDSLHGIIEVDSKVGVGSVFKITLPCLMANTFANVDTSTVWCNKEARMIPKSAQDTHLETSLH